ncbi:XRE family transcriptional regulator [Marinovum sp. B10]|uniref:XRE family transcriptional regulator n=1 Tax=Marinovum sp. B10 TaxID=3449224 RepID=UPI003EDB9072
MVWATVPGARLRAFRASLDLEQRELAATLGVSASGISMAESGKSNVSKKLTDKLFSVYGVSPNWLMHGVGEMLIAKQRFQGRTSVVSPPDYNQPAHGDVQIDGVDFQRIKRFEVSGSAGKGALVESEKVIDQVAFTSSWLLRMGINGDLAALIEVRGDSMAPGLLDGSLALVHFTEHEVESGHVYAFLLDSELFIKRLALIEGGYLVISDNPSHQPYKIVGTDADRLFVHGRIRASITSI